MPDPDLVCEVRTEGGIYRDWLTVQVLQSFDEPSWNRHFRLTCAEPSPEVLRLLPKARVDIALAGKVVIQEGYIKNAQAYLDGNRHVALVTGYSKAGPITEVSAKAGTGQFRGYTLEQIANAVLKPHGIKFRIDNPPPGAEAPFPNVRIHHGETPFDLISRLARQRRLWLHAEKDGTVVGAGGGEGGKIVFQEGRNILSINRSITMPEVDRIISRSQQPGSDSLFGKKAAEVGASAKLQNGVGGLERRVLAEMPLDQRGVQMRADMEVQAIESSLFNVNLTYKGWLTPGGELWDMKDFATIRSPSTIPTKDGEVELKLWGYAYTQSPEGQTITSADFVSKTAFAQQHRQAGEQDNFFNREGQPAQPEQAT